MGHRYRKRLEVRSCWTFHMLLLHTLDAAGRDTSRRISTSNMHVDAFRQKTFRRVSLTLLAPRLTIRCMLSRTAHGPRPDHMSLLTGNIRMRAGPAWWLAHGSGMSNNMPGKYSYHAEILHLNPPAILSNSRDHDPASQSQVMERDIV